MTTTKTALSFRPEDGSGLDWTGDVRFFCVIIGFFSVLRMFVDLD